MYTLMNKSRALIDFEFEYLETSGEYRIVERKIYHKPWFISDLDHWTQTRFAPKTRVHIGRLYNLLGLQNTKDLVDFSKGLSLTDTLWINENDRFQWETINLFDNPFDDTLARMAFNGKAHCRGLHAISPELTTDGALAKCWVRSDAGIFLMKQGRGNTGLEPYSEQYCSQILDVLGYDHVGYDAVMYQDKLVCKCKLLSNEKIMLLPMFACLDDPNYNGVVEFCGRYGMLESLYRIVVFDYLVTNNDRHLNNIAVLLDADTFEIQGLAPIFDNGAGLLPHAVPEHLQSYKLAAGYAAGKRPRLYGSFYWAARHAIERMDSAPVRRLLDFSFSRTDEYPLPQWRVTALEEYVRLQAKHLLNGNDPMDEAQIMGIA